MKTKKSLDRGARFREKQRRKGRRPVRYWVTDCEMDQVDQFLKWLRKAGADWIDYETINL